MASKQTPGVRAAGAVVWRARDRAIEVAVVHRPRYDDWSLPKGKLEEGERAVCAAVREVAEETGSTVALSRRLPTVRYAVPDGRKEVTFWLARHIAGTFTPNDEVDEVAWLPLSEAAGRVAYKGDRKVLDTAAALPVPDSIVVLVRHARAGKRSAWKGEDCDRPLSGSGRTQADRLAHWLPAFGPTRVISAEPVRCRQTVAPFAAAAGLEVTVDEAFGDHGFEADPDASEAALRRLARPGAVTAVVSQGTAIPGLLDRMWQAQRLPDTRKGQAWVLGFVDGELAFADHHPDAGRA